MARVRVTSRVAKGVYISSSYPAGLFALVYIPWVLLSTSVQIAWALTVFAVKLTLALTRFTFILAGMLALVALAASALLVMFTVTTLRLTVLASAWGVRQVQAHQQQRRLITRRNPGRL